MGDDRADAAGITDPAVQGPEGQERSLLAISYTRAMKSHTEYVRQECVADVRRQIAAYKRFKTLTEQWIDVSIEASKLKMQIAKKRGSE